MKNRILTFFVVTLIIGSLNNLKAQDKKFGIGGELLSPTGISVKYALNEKSAITGAIGAFFSDFNNSAGVEINYVMYRNPDYINIESGRLSPYFSGGLIFNFNEVSDDVGISLKVPFGVEYDVDNTPVGIYMDIGPVVGINPNVTFGFRSSLGFRFHF